jgi:hypothetical protein
MLRRVAPALLLLVLSPIVAEFLLGDFTVRQIALVLVFLLLYGGGALLIREVARRTGRGWPTMLLLAVAYALVEEGFATQSLFNPNYAGQRLLDYGFVPALGIGLPWTVFVLSIHVVWSIATPVAIVEGLAAERRTAPWLGRVGLPVTAALYLAGVAGTAAFTMQQYPFTAAPGQFAAVAILVVACVAAAFLAFRPQPAERVDGWTPPPWLAGVVALALSSAFVVIEGDARQWGLPAAVTVLGMLACEAVAIVAFGLWSRRRGWGPLHPVAMAAGAVLTYSWLSLNAFLVRGQTNLGVRVDAVDIAGQVVLVALVLALVGWAALRTRQAPRSAAIPAPGQPA